MIIIIVVVAVIVIIIIVIIIINVVSCHKVWSVFYTTMNNEAARHEGHGEVLTIHNLEMSLSHGYLNSKIHFKNKIWVGRSCLECAVN